MNKMKQNEENEAKRSKTKQNEEKQGKMKENQILNYDRPPPPPAAQIFNEYYGAT